MKKQEYVVGFMFDSGMRDVVLVRKNRPGWQAGKLNGVGGHIEDGETPEQAMAREFREEAGVTQSDPWLKFCTQECTTAVIHYFFCVSDFGFDCACTCTDEDIVHVTISFLSPKDIVLHTLWLLDAAISIHNLPDYASQFPGEDVDRKTDSYTIVQPQPRPVDNTGDPIWDLVIRDMRARDEFGRAKYGVSLRAFNGRDALVDAYQESLDLSAYLRQEIEERDFGVVSQGLNKIIPELKR